MADHLHKQIRDAVAALLTGLTTTGSRVYPNRLQPMADANLPGLRVFMDAEEVADSFLDKAQERRIDLIVECCAKATTVLDDTLDASSKEVEVALSGGITLSGYWIDVQYGGMQFDDDLADKPVGVKRLRFALTYTAAGSAPDVLI